jgi:hypothetical protein
VLPLRPAATTKTTFGDVGLLINSFVVAFALSRQVDDLRRSPPAKA